MSEINLFILWKYALEKQEEILKDIKKSFEIIEVYEVNWSDEEYSNNLSRFYGTKLPDGSYKEEHCGRGTFLLVIVRDKKPKYEQRQTSRGPETVNVNMFDKKSYYRKLTGGGHRIHGTNSEIETNHDLTLLLGQNVEDFMKKHKKLWNGKIKKWNQDLFGAGQFQTVKDMFYALNNCCNYAIIRNYESLPEEIYVNEHNDIDIVCESYEEVAYILNAKKVFEEEYRIHHAVRVEDKIAYFDLRYVGDNYYDIEIEKRILEKRVYNNKGFYTVDDETYFYILLYHALIHKLEFAKDYQERLKKMNADYAKNASGSVKDAMLYLNKWLLEHEYIVVRPIDLSVRFNTEHCQYLSRLVYRFADYDHLVKKINVLNEQNEVLEKRYQMSEDRYAGIISSKTWKITSPIRKVKGLVKKRK